jgi:stress-induced morphogen
MASVDTESIRERLAEAFPRATELAVDDRTGTGDHFQVTIVSSDFDGLSLLDQHRRVNDVLASSIADGSIHELRIRTRGTT